MSDKESPVDDGGLQVQLETSVRELAEVLSKEEFTPVLADYEIRLAREKEEKAPLRDDWDKIHIALDTIRVSWGSCQWGSRVKLVDLAQSFVSCVKGNHLVGASCLARPIFELTAVIHRVTGDLTETVENRKNYGWKHRSESFQSTLRRATLGFRSVPSSPKPMNVMKCVERLGDSPDWKSVVRIYSLLSDYSHPNALGLMVDFDGEKQVHRFPREFKASDIGFEREIVARCLNQVWKDLRDCPDSPFTPTELIGVPDVFRSHVRASLDTMWNPPVAPKAVRRNFPCPCGSGQKYKRCHGAN